MRWLGQKLASFVWWNYPRGSVEYDVMVAIILAFIFLTPARVFHDQPQPAAPPPRVHALDLHRHRPAPTAKPAGAGLVPLPRPGADPARAVA